MNIITIIPPLVQLNAPYPSGAYLTSFFKKMGCNACWNDLSIELYYQIFSKEGLTELFSLTKQKALKIAQKAQNDGDENTAYNLRRYISTSSTWISWIDTINAILCGKAREKEHELLYSPFAPRGNRMENFLANLEHEPTVDDVRFLCSYALADLADYITAVFDQNFSLIRYAESVATDKRTFTEIENSLNSPVLETFYEQVLNKYKGGGSLPLASACQQSSATPSNGGSTPVTPPDYFLISIPFAGTFIPALYTARWIRKNYPETKIIIGGGYVNTEMRDWTNPELGKYIDYISYDRGYGSYVELLSKTDNQKKTEQIYKLLQFQKKKSGEIQIVTPLWQNPEIEKKEVEITRTTFPDYSDIDFSKYLRVCDDKNPMHRLWTDGAWIKAYLAHGCYWHRCAFCDTKLDYVCGYKIVEVEALYESLLKTAQEKGVYGIHFVDEALPPVAVLRFALCNARHGNPLYFWGNVRFEKAWTKDLAALLSYCGFGGVSAGLEVATGQGLKNINKGTDINSIVSACAAFKEAGILVHAYMIYGFWYDTPQTIIDSMETLRQFYAAGLLDSSFWHQFMLTKYSPKYDELKSSFNPSKYNKYGPILESALDSWMHGEKLETKVQKWFDFQVPSPTISKDFIEKCIEKYEFENEKKKNGEKYWIGSIPVIVSNTKKTVVLRWIYLQEENEQEFPLSSGAVEEFISLLENLMPPTNEENRLKALKQIEKTQEYSSCLKLLKNKGLVTV